MTTEKRRVLKRGELILLLVALFILLTFVLQKMGVPIMSTTEDSELIQKPHEGYPGYED